jgi:hypothetical protein
MLLIALSVISYFVQGNAWLPLMVLLGGTIGVPMGLLYPFPLLTKISMVAGLLLSLLAIIYGFKNSKVIIGQVTAVTGITVWSFIGLIGLGTGT